MQGLSSKVYRACVGFGLSVLSIFGDASAWADVASDADRGAEAPGSRLEEILVTARRRSESLQDTPISVTALAAEDIRQRSLNSLADIARSTPSLQFDVSSGDSGNASAAYVRVRGIGPSDYNITADPAVGMYIDGIYYARPVGSVMDLLDIERVEVLRGPQGTLFGKNTPGGAINITTATPGETFGGLAQFTTGSYRRGDADLVLNGPVVSDRLAAKLAIATRNRDGYGERDDGQRLGGGNDFIARTQFLYTPADAFTLLLSLDGTQKRDQSAVEQLVKVDPNGGLTPFWNALYGAPRQQNFGPQYITNDPYRTHQTGFNEANLDGFGGSVQATWRLPSVTLKSLSAFRQAKALYGSDLDNSPLYYHENVTEEHQRELSQEFQLSGTAIAHRLDWVTGLYYFNEHGRDLLHVRLAQGLYQAVEALPGPVIPTGPGVICPSPACLGGLHNPANVLVDVNLDDYLALKTASYAAYGQAEFHFTEALSGTFGLRYTYETKDFTGWTYHTQAGVYEVPPTSRSASFHDVSPRFGVEFKLFPDLMVYGSIAEGFKSGGFNGRLNSVDSVVPYNPEKAWTYETGAKSEFFEHRLRLNGSVFYTRYTDLQLTSNGHNGFQSFVITQNAGKARIRGFELEMDAVPSSHWHLSSGIGFVDAAYIELSPNVTATALGNKFDHTPRWTGNASATYTLEAGAIGKFDLRSDYSYRSAYFNDTRNTASIRQGSYGLLNARVTYFVPDPHQAISVAVFVTNITDKVYTTGGLDTSAIDGSAVVYPGRPREWGLSGAFRF